ncbi:MAG: nicotinate (nicotinamide) nucleotide adenylyltransferase, partial [Bacillota bacterium]|nr:nicotinate (nicotinamide) nucleotide adenylyltransferase [Bacillota bacterium]
AAAREQLNLDKVLLIPAGMPPHKAVPEGSPGKDERLEMVKLAAFEYPFLEACDLEIRRSGKSYTIDTVSELKKKYADASFDLIVGTDMLLNLENWHRADELFKLVRVAAVRRRSSDEAAILGKAREYERKFGADIVLINCVAIEISSTEIRKEIKSGRGEKWIPGGVLRYINERKLYV